MKAKPDQILFVSHKANRSGATILLLEIIREFKKQSSMPVKIILMEDGPLVDAFNLLAPVFVWPSGKMVKSFFIFQWISRIQTIVRGLIILFQVRRTTIVFSNTITNGHLQRKLNFLHAKWMTYVHELQVSIHALTNQDTLKTVLKGTAYFLAGSKAVKENLIRAHHISPEKISVVYSSIPQIDRQKRDYLNDIGQLKNRLDIPVDSPVIGVAAENEWRKGFDWFAPLVQLYINEFPGSRAHFIWMGARKDRVNYVGDMLDMEKFGINNRMHLIEHGAQYLQTMASYDIHLLLSREDPFPLVVLDAASFAIPTVCFLGGGGTPEFVEEDAGICIPYGDLMNCARALHELETKVEKRVQLGAQARNKLKRGFEQQTATAEIIQLINQQL